MTQLVDSPPEAPPSAVPNGPISPRPRRIATPRWLDLRMILGVVLVLGSILLGARVGAGASQTMPTVTAAHDLAAGTVLTAADLRLSQVQLPEGSAVTYLTRTTQAVGKRLTRPVSQGELIPHAAVHAIAPQTTLTVPFPTGAAPDLRAGQRIEIWVSTPTCPSIVLLSDVVVQAAHRDDGTSFSTGGSGQNVVIDVAPGLADRVMRALAIDQAKLRAGILVGGAVRSDAGLVGQDDLAACSAAPPR